MNVWINICSACSRYFKIRVSIKLHARMPKRKITRLQIPQILLSSQSDLCLTIAVVVVVALPDSKTTKGKTINIYTYI